MSEQISMSTGSGLLTLNLSVSSQNGSSLAPGGALFSGFGSVLSQLPGQETELASGAFLPQSGGSLPQVSDNGLLPEISLEQKMLYIAQMLEQQYGEGAELPTELPTEVAEELASALKQFAEQRSKIDEKATTTDSDIAPIDVDEGLATATVVGPPILLSDLEESIRNGALSESLKAVFDKVMVASDKVALSDDVDVTVLQNGVLTKLMGNAEDVLALERGSNAEEAKAIDALTVAMLASLTRDEKTAVLEAQNARMSSPEVGLSAQIRVTEGAAKVNPAIIASPFPSKSTNERVPSAEASLSIDDGLDTMLHSGVKRDNSIVGRSSDKVDLMSLNAQKEVAAELAVKPELSTKTVSGGVLPEKFESALELSKQLLQKVTANEKAVDNNFSQRMETLVQAQTQPTAGVIQPTQAQKVVSDGQNLMMPQQVQINTPAWKNALGERAIMVSTQNLNVANIQLDPPELGSLSVRVHMNQDQQVSLNFTSPHAHVRDAVEQSLPRLREMFAEQGLSLQDSSVADQSADQQHREQFAEQGETGNSGSSYMESGEAGSEEPLAQVESKPMSLVDYYA